MRLKLYEQAMLEKKRAYVRSIQVTSRYVSNVSRQQRVRTKTSQGFAYIERCSLICLLPDLRHCIG
jgi:hypothetical protein